MDLHFRLWYHITALTREKIGNYPIPIEGKAAEEETERGRGTHQEGGGNQKEDGAGVLKFGADRKAHFIAIRRLDQKEEGRQLVRE